MASDALQPPRQTRRALGAVVCLRLVMEVSSSATRSCESATLAVPSLTRKRCLLFDCADKRFGVGYALHFSADLSGSCYDQCMLETYR